MTQSTERSPDELGTDLHRLFTQAAGQYANLTRAFVEQWQNTAGSQPGTPGVPPAPDLARTLSEWFQRSVLGAGVDPAQAWFRFAGLPGMSARESGDPAGQAASLEHVLRQQEQTARRMMELAAQCQRLQSQLATHWSAVGQQTAQDFLARMKGATLPGADQSQWPQQMYNAWIDTAERAYQEAARGAEYAHLLSSLANAANAFKAEQHQLFEIWARFFDYPTRADIDALHRELREMREQIRSLKRTP